MAYHVERASETAPTPDDHSKKDSATEPMDTTQDGAGDRPKTSEAAAQSTGAAKTPEAPRSSEPQAAATGGVFCPFGSIPQNLGAVPKPTPAPVPESEPTTVRLASGRGLQFSENCTQAALKTGSHICVWVQSSALARYVERPHRRHLSSNPGNCSDLPLLNFYTLFFHPRLKVILTML